MLGDQEQRHADDGRQQRRTERDLGVQLELLVAEVIVDDVVPDDEADAADQNQRTDCDQHQRIIDILGQGTAGRGNAEDIEAGVAERGDGMEDGVPGAQSRTVFRNEADAQQHGAGALEDRGADQNALHHADDAAELAGAHGFRQHGTLMQADALADQEGEAQRKGHEAQAAALDQKQDHELAEERELRPDIIDDQAGDAGGAGGRKQGIQKRRGHSRAAGDRETQQDTAQQNDSRKSERQFTRDF